jgi:acyl-CoA synthetase (AMP-forming)/AMP-acid ligase II
MRHEVRYKQRVVRCFADRPPNIDTMFRAAVSRFPDRDALVLDDRRVTYRELDGIVDRVAANLVHAGFKPGERIALLLGNGLEFVYCFLAAARAGLLSVPMNTRQRLPEVEFVLNQCGAACLVYDAEHEANVPGAVTVPTLRASYVVGGGLATDFSRLMAEAPRVEFAEVAEEDTLCLLYTSGTTGKPKGAMLTHVSSIHSVIHYQHAFGMQEGDVAVLAVPASHVTGIIAILLATIQVGGCTVIMQAFKARKFLEIAARERIHYTLMVPAMYNLCLLDPDFASFDLSQWRTAGFGGAPMPAATISRLADALPNLSLRNVYGSTETTSPATLLPAGAINTHPKSVGKVLPCADVIVVDEGGHEVPPGESGEILIGGAMVVPGYWDNPTGNATGFVGGYWVSGDIGSKDAEGFVYVFDRKKDMINRAGFKVYCIEVESVIAHHPSVVETAVIGKPDEVLGERVHAFVFSGGRPADEGDIRRFCAERLSDYKVPDTITFLQEPLPRNAAGKVLKTALRAMLQS